MILYGIKNCDTVKKARRYLDDNDVVYTFHDFRVAGLDEAMINNWLKSVTWDILLNKRSTTWRNIDQQDKDAITADSAITLMMANPTLIKRPVLETGNKVIIGFNKAMYEEIV